ncbi:capsule assembly Wzi family protein [Hymenobacter latericus]|uniref:capsule assembly Wzi family protein n=1 Tax=Hymenobacter sp. YIM 151858-1 TaxID=2987688 RepID=UPI00222716FB|nr:capsule assembly Wzi family protein [Hymenobacter sp. YIM 151858-1]UYZ58807.1 capsule assembly Wzi family protein [Hymenobacter sp. YIM 151858-1]
MNNRLLWILLGLAPATASFAQQVPTPVQPQPVDTVQVPPASAPVPAPTPVTVTPPSAQQPTPERIEATDAKPLLQAPVYVPLDLDVYRLIDRYAIKYGPDSVGDIHTTIRPYNRAAVARLAERIYPREGIVTPTDAPPNDVRVLEFGARGERRNSIERFNILYLLRDNWQYVTDPSLRAENVSKKPFLKHFYRNPADLYSVQTPDFTLRVNPVLHFQVGTDTDSDGLRFVNTRGAVIEGTIDKRLGFFTYFVDNQTSVPLYVQQRVERDNAVPHEGYWKLFKDKRGQYDFLTARGYVTYAATKHINVQLGHDRNFVGNGYRSLILSDFSAPYFFLKLNTRVWKFNYQNIFAELTAERTPDRDTIFQKKYMAFHHLSLDITPSLNVGVFESVMFGRGKGRFELQYLNPLIFYRSIEQHVGSNDNAILGADFKWNILKRGQIYGQVVLDELIVSQVRAGNGWWGNKQSVQLGAKYLDVLGLRNLDLQAEFNYIRPYTYQHADLYRAYEHYGQPLAHPMGANLREVLGVLTYQPLPRLTLVGKAFYVQQGIDFDDRAEGTNLGSNVLRSYNTRPRDAAGNLIDFGYRTADGRRHNLLHTDLTATWQARHNLWFDAKLIARNSNLFGNAIIPSVSLRWNAAQRLLEF